jgi:hypothetical protein
MKKDNDTSMFYLWMVNIILIWINALIQLLIYLK